MKTQEYADGPEALQKFKRGIIALFKVAKDSVVKAEKKERKKRSVVSQS